MELKNIIETIIYKSWKIDALVGLNVSKQEYLKYISHYYYYLRVDKKIFFQNFSKKSKFEFEAP